MDDQQFYEELKKQFVNVYTKSDKEYMEYISKPDPEPPIIKIDLRQSNNVTKSIDFNSRLKKNLDKSGTDIFAKMNLSKKNSKEK